MADDTKKETKVAAAAQQATNPGDGPDLEQIYREYHRRVLQAAYRVTGNASDAEDVLQTIFLRLARREGGSPLSDSPGNYLHRAAVNAALDLVRSRQAARATPIEDLEPVLARPETESPERSQGGQEIRGRIRAALAKMSARNAEIFILRYFEGYGNHEIAKMLGTSRGTINVILHRVRERLREDIGPYVGDRP